MYIQFKENNLKRFRLNNSLKKIFNFFFKLFTKYYNKSLWESKSLISFPIFNTKLYQIFKKYQQEILIFKKD